MIPQTSRSRPSPCAALVLALGLGCVAPALAAAETEPLDPAATFATVDDAVITIGEYAEALREGARHTFYHAQPPEGELAAFQQRVAQALIDRRLLVAEAGRRGLSPDNASVQESLGRAAAGGADAETLAQLRQRLEEESLIERLEAQARSVPEPTEAAVRAYYQEHPDLFTEPAQLRLSVILLRVEPSAGSAAWTAARDEAADLLRRVRAGADFAELARLHSGDGSAAQGGDMGYLHQGMLAPEIEQAALPLQPGDLAEPVTVLEGVVLARLDDRREARLSPFEAVAERAESLLRREQSDAALVTLRDGLRAAARIEMRDDLLRPDGGMGDGPGRG